MSRTVQTIARSVVFALPLVMLPVHVFAQASYTWRNVLDTAGGFLYVAYSDKGGPYDGGHGDVWKLNTATGAWTLISPIPSSNTNDNFFGYSGLSIDRQHPNTMMVTGYSSWWPDTQIWRSTNGGATWSRIWDWTRYPNRSFRYTQDVTASPWLKFPTAPLCGGGRPGAEVNPKLGWMTEALEIDPFNSDRFMYGTGATLYGSTNLTTWDLSATSQITVRVMAQGIEETAVQDLISPPSGAPLISALGDITGFRHNDVNVVPAAQAAPVRGSSVSLDYAELSPSYIVRAANGDTANCEKSPAVSTDGGTTWAAVSAQPAGLTGGGVVRFLRLAAARSCGVPRALVCSTRRVAGKRGLLPRAYQRARESHRIA